MINHASLRYRRNVRRSSPINFSNLSTSMSSEAPQFQWTGQFNVTSSRQTGKLLGDKILLPPSALEQLLAAAPVVSSDDTSSYHSRPSFDPYNPYSVAAERHARAQSQFTQQQLPQPLTFRIVNPQNNRVVYAGIQEFSAEEGQASLSHYLIDVLGLRSYSNHAVSKLPFDSDATVSDESVDDYAGILGKITVHVKQLPKGTFVKLRPLEAGYDPDDWKALLEEHLRKNFTTLTKGELLKVPTGRELAGGNGGFEFLIDELVPDGDAICVIDTDLEVDIEALNADQALETLRRINAKIHKLPGSKDGSSNGGDLLLLREVTGYVAPGEYVDYKLSSWDRTRGVDVQLSCEQDISEELNLLVSPFSARQRRKPREEEHVFADFRGRPQKRLTFSPTNMELENAEEIWISVHAPVTDSLSTAREFTLRVEPYSPMDDDSRNNTPQTAGTEEVKCDNCHQLVPKQSLILHQNFCFRNNVLCPHGCGQVFQKRSETWKDHWHCPHDGLFGNTVASHSRHDSMFHKTYQCPNCSAVASSLPQLATHRTSVCPGKIILCRFCHLEVPQEGDPDHPDHEALFAGLTSHELLDGARTTECHLCQKIVRLRDMATHLKYHDFERLNRDIPRLCRNINCGRTLDGTGKNGDTRAASRMGQGPGNDIGLCSVCYGPLYVATYDPDGKALKRRVERSYLKKLLSGCGYSWCQNEFCKDGRKNSGIDPGKSAVPTRDAIPMVQSFVNGLTGGVTPLHFCVDESSQRRRGLATLLQAEENSQPTKASYELSWCMASLEAEANDLGRAREWLHNFAPRIDEVR